MADGITESDALKMQIKLFQSGLRLREVWEERFHSQKDRLFTSKQEASVLFHSHFA